MPAVLIISSMADASALREPVQVAPVPERVGVERFVHFPSVDSAVPRRIFKVGRALGSVTNEDVLSLAYAAVKAFNDMAPSDGNSQQAESVDQVLKWHADLHEVETTPAKASDAPVNPGPDSAPQIDPRPVRVDLVAPFEWDVTLVEANLDAYRAEQTRAERRSMRFSSWRCP